MFAQIKKIYHSKWFPRFFYKKPDGGKNSGVTAYFLLEWKILFSVGLLHFNPGTREAFHSHAFNAITWWLKGSVTELYPNGLPWGKLFQASFKPKITPRTCVHKIMAHESTWALTFRGPWKDTWQEIRPEGLVTLTHGRVQVMNIEDLENPFKSSYL